MQNMSSLFQPLLLFGGFHEYLVYVYMYASTKFHLWQGLHGWAPLTFFSRKYCILQTTK